MVEAAHSEDSTFSLSALLVGISCFACLGLAVGIYSTALNPGLPIMGGGALAAGWCLQRLIRGAGPYYSLGLDGVLLLLLWMVVCSVFGLDGYLNQRSLATFCGATGFVLAVQCGVRHGLAWRSLASGLVLLVSIICAFAWPSVVEKAMETGTVPPLMGTYNNPDAFSVLPMLALCLSFGLVEKSRGKGTTLLMAQVGLLSVSLLATGCRSAMLGTGVAAVVFFGLLLRERGSKLQKSRLLLGFPLIVALAMLPLSNFALQGVDKVSRTFSDGALERESSRLEVARHGWKAVVRFPLFGSGPGAFGLAFQEVRPPDQDSLYVNIAHNDLLEIGRGAGGCRPCFVDRDLDGGAAEDV